MSGVEGRCFISLKETQELAQRVLSKSRKVHRYFNHEPYQRDLKKLWGGWGPFPYQCKDSIVGFTATDHPNEKELLVGTTSVLWSGYGLEGWGWGVQAPIRD